MYSVMIFCFFFFFSSRRRHTRYWRDWSSDVCSSDLKQPLKIQIIKYLIGIIIAVAIKSSFKIFLPKNNLGEFIRFFALGIWVTILAPYIFSKISKKHKKPSL